MGWIMPLLSRARLLLVALWRREEPPIAPAAEVVETEAPPVQTKARARKASPSAEYGEFYFRDTILEQLDRYFVILRRMRKNSPESFGLYKRIGARIIPNRFATQRGDETGLTGWWRDHRPTFGMVMYGTTREAKVMEDEGKYLAPFAVEFKKYEPSHAPRTIQPAPGKDIYVVTVHWDDLRSDGKMKSGVPTDFPVCIDANGDVAVLRTLLASEVVIQPKKRAKRGLPFTAPTKQWGMHHWFVTWAREHNTDPFMFLGCIFIESANRYAAAANGMVQVKARKGGITATFNVDIIRTPYFFRDRGVTVGEEGKKKPVFHIVKTHLRAIGPGRQVPVRTHFRGERSFAWNGYQISISVPGWHHLSLAELDLGLVEEETADRPLDEYGKFEDIATEVARIEAHGIGAKRRRRG